MSKDLMVVGEGPTSIETYAENLQAKMQVATILLKSGMAPSHYKSPEAVLGAVLYGRELGFSPIRALQAINVIQGKPVLSAEGLKALAIQHGGKIQTVEWTDKVCTLKCTRNDWEETCTFTWEDAERQQLTGKDNWRRMPKAMLYARCVSTLVRNMFADVIGGLYSAEEMRDSTTVEPPPVAPKTPRKRVGGSVVDISTGEVVEDDLPESFTSSNDRAGKAQQLVDSGDFQSIAAWVIESKGTTYRMTVRDACSKYPEKVLENLEKYQVADRTVLEAWIHSLDFLDEAMTGNKGKEPNV